MTLELLPHSLVVCRLPPQEMPPSDLDKLPFYSVTRTAEELSLVLPEEAVPKGWPTQFGFRALRIKGVLDFSLAGVLSSLLAPLAAADISVFTISTFDTDIILVPAAKIRQAVGILRQAGHTVPGTIS